MEKYIHFEIRFDNAWLISQRGNDVTPTSWLASMIAKSYDVGEITKRINGCDGTLSLPAEETSSEFAKELGERIKSGLHIDDKIFTVGIKEVDHTENKTAPSKNEESEKKAAAKDEKKAEQPPAESEKNDNSDREKKKTAYDRISDLVGAEEFKALAKECRDSAEGFIKNDLLDVFRSRSYLFSVSDGDGMSTYLRLFAELLEETGLYKSHSGGIYSSDTSKYAEIIIDPPSKEDCFEKPLEYFQGKASGKLLCVDISEWMQKLSSIEFRRFLKAVSDSENEHIVVFRVPFIEKDVLKDTEYILNDILYVKSVSIPPFTGEELAECAGKYLEEKNYSMDEDAWKLFDLLISAEKNDGRFYGIDTVHKVVNSILYTKQLSGNSDVKNITAADIKPLADAAAVDTGDVTKALDELVGMDDVKLRMKEIVSQIEAAKSNASLGKPSMHMRFLGNPGTGKTTVARILGQLLKEKKILRNGGFIEVQGRDLCGRYIGETAPKTAAICREAYGSVLFIDEAYSLYKEDSPRDYGKEAIETLLAEMENHRDDMVVIMAGYNEEMESLLKANPGFASRMPYTIEFSNYKTDELCSIFMGQVKKNFEYDDAFEKCVSEYFGSLSDDILKSKNFSNARFVRNLFERTWAKAAMRCQMEGTECVRLTASDFSLAAADKEFTLKAMDKKRRLGF